MHKQKLLDGQDSPLCNKSGVSEKYCKLIARNCNIRQHIKSQINSKMNSLVGILQF